MIIDQITNSHLYYALNPRINHAFSYIHQADLSAISVGKYEIDGENIYAMVQEYYTKPKEQCLWEAHRRYIELQYVIQGVEQIGFANTSRLNHGEYDASKDFLPLFGEGDFLTLHKGNFVIFMPEDAHMPGIVFDSPNPVKKIVIKISVV